VKLTAAESGVSVPSPSSNIYELCTQTDHVGDCIKFSHVHPSRTKTAGGDGKKGPEPKPTLEVPSHEQRDFTTWSVVMSLVRSMLVIDGYLVIW